ncbi:MAG: TlpA disulfide reductase family protein [Candidatus Margulisiibacteriota bacterium]
MRSKYILPGLIVIFILLQILGMGERVKDKDNTAPAAATSATPEIGLTDLNGNSVKLSDFYGKAVLLSFFATWCPPCRTEMPIIEKLKTYMAGEEFVVLVVNVQEPDARVAAFIKENNYTFRVLLDSEGLLSRYYQVRSIPTSFLLDKTGKVQRKVVGAVDWMEDPLLKLIKDTINIDG